MPTLPDSALDRILTAQLAVAWAGEGGEEPRLGWWKTFMLHPDGGLALLADLAPSTATWAAWQGAREAARRADAALRARDHDADRLFTLYRFGFEIDERLDERLGELKRSGRSPTNALPTLSQVFADPRAANPTWNASHFEDWVAGHGDASSVVSPAGRRLTGVRPSDVETQVRQLVAALHPVPGAYPMPHYRAG